MNPSLPNQPGFELPAPSTGEANPVTPLPEQAPLQSEQASKQAELPGASLPAVPAQTPAPEPPTAPVSAIPNDPAPAASASALSGVAPAMADDLDLIEKEWVDKAKAIVDHTREDPHQQNKQLNEFKADYMKKRYGKEVRLTDE